MLAVRPRVAGHLALAGVEGPVGSKPRLVAPEPLVHEPAKLPLRQGPVSDRDLVDEAGQKGGDVLEPGGSEEQRGFGVERYAVDGGMALPSERAVDVEPEGVAVVDEGDMVPARHAGGLLADEGGDLPAESSHLPPASTSGLSSVLSSWKKTS